MTETMKLTERDAAILRAVEAGQVRHVHPFTWVLPLELLDITQPQRGLDKLTRQGLVKVEATSAEYHRPVRLTEAGRAALLPE